MIFENSYMRIVWRSTLMVRRNITVFLYIINFIYRLKEFSVNLRSQFGMT